MKKRRTPLNRADRDGQGTVLRGRGQGTFFCLCADRERFFVRISYSLWFRYDFLGFCFLYFYEPNLISFICMPHEISHIRNNRDMGAVNNQKFAI
jgi:hypothetical protein